MVRLISGYRFFMFCLLSINFRLKVCSVNGLVSVLLVMVWVVLVWLFRWMWNGWLLWVSFSGDLVLLFREKGLFF